MSSNKRGLGRGLDALLGDVSIKEEKHQLRTLPIDFLQQGNHLPSDDMNADELQLLANSITSAGAFEPVVVRKTAEDNYEIIAGERRWRAARLAGLQEVPVIIKEMDDREAIATTLIEAVQQESLYLLQEAEALRKLIDEFEVMVRTFE